MGNGASTKHENIDAAKIAVDSLHQLLDVLIAGEVRAANVASPPSGANLFGSRFEPVTTAS